MSTPTTVPSASATIEPGRLVADRYLLLARVGRGGSGSVWRAHDELLDREVAVKRLHGGQALDALRSAMVRDRAHREGRVAARLHHPRLAAIYDMAELDGEVCLVMEYVAAPSLADLLDWKGPLPAARVVVIGAQIAEGLAAMHRSGVVHRDIKPANIMIGPDDAVTITDFGIAIIGTDGGADHHLVAGTPGYMAPELAWGETPTAKADMYSLGATLYAALEGAPPRPEAGEVLERLSEIGAGGGRSGRLGPVLRALLDLDPDRRPSALSAARQLTGGAVAVGPTGAVGAGARASTAELTPEDGVDDGAPGARAVGGVRGSRDVEDAAPESAPPAGRHRAAMGAWQRPSRRVLGAGLAGVLGVAGLVALATGPDPAPLPPASPSVMQAAPPPLPLAGAPIVPAAPTTATSTPVDEVASAGPTRSERRARASAQVPAADDGDRAPGPGRGQGRGEGRGDDEKEDKKEEKEDKDDEKGEGAGNGRGRGK
ncbi:serine/threonine-protein kinase [Actinomycetospora cinnamomea]|uniref:non-specific serine/threonine protein kinase n=1 Tax=Actinomycetospora cinnamomea TaxID=663609 RepID=A0A2U1EDN9_9PSEU|nr:serine/threonine-protein kinase [Actinomycetospora cinnamomea]PVY97982.1 serine/threonine protein kinase [Actinomycetospora cinnamomea]